MSVGENLTLPLITNYNLTGLDVVLLYLNDVTSNVFMKIMLFTTFLIIAFGIFYASKRSVGTGDFPVAFAVASFTTTIFAFILRLRSGLVDGISIAVLIVMCLIGILMLMFDDEQG
jgi:hypothetical protein